jgi:hypothetical protein
LSWWRIVIRRQDILIVFDYTALSRAITEVLAKDLFFIAGAIKSGTTWLQLMLDAHPQIACRGEGHFEHFLAPALQKSVINYNQAIKEKNKTIFREIQGFPLLTQEHLLFLLVSAIGLQLASYGGDKEVKAVGEKTPDNIRALPMLSQLFPNARFIHIIRDGRDVAVSGWFHNLRVSPDWTMQTFGNLASYIETIAPIWVKEIETGRQFGQAHPDRFLELRYEDLHRDTGNELLRLLEFLGVDASPDIVAMCCEATTFERLSGGRKHGDEDQRSHFRKGSVGDWQNHMDNPARNVFDKHAGGLLQELGYQ